MRIAIGFICAGLLGAGCVHQKPPGQHPLPPHRITPPPQTIITPELGTLGRVEMVNNEGRFVVLSFPSGHVPPAGRHWRIKRAGQTVGKVIITGPQRDLDTVADIVEGEAKVGDEAAPE